MKRLLQVLLLLIITGVARQSVAQTSDQQSQLDEINAIINNANSHDTLLAAAYLRLATTLYLSNLDTMIPLCLKTQEVVEKALESQPSEKVKQSLLKSLAEAFANIGYVYGKKGDIEKQIKYYHKGLEIYEVIGNKEGIANSLNSIGNKYYNQGDFTKAMDYWTRSLKIREEIGDKEGMASSYTSLGASSYNQGNIPVALEYHHKSLKIREETNNKKGIANSLNHIGGIYKKQGDIPKTLEYLKKSLKILEEIGDKNGIALSLNNFGIIYKNLDDIPRALTYFQRSLKIFEEAGNKRGIALSLNNLGLIYSKQKDITKALEYYNKSLKIREELDDKKGMATSLNSIGAAYFEIDNVNKARTYTQRSIKLAQGLGYPTSIKEAAELLSKIEKKKGNYKESLKMYELYITMRDSISSEENQKATIEQEAKYTYEKQKAIDDAENEKLMAIEQEEKQRQSIIIYAAIGLSGLLVVFLVFVFNRLRVTRKQKLVIEEQKEEVELAHHQLEEKSNEILDSINYAKRIQSAILPPENIVKENLKDSFILYKPKDIVAGDFYWMEKKEGKVLFAAADCTGHGVPGAMVSVICNNALNRSVKEYGLIDPGEILNKSRDIVIQEFEKSDEEVSDGMDIALCSLEGNTLQYAGAHNPLWIVRKGEIIETKANKQPIGKFDNLQSYTTHTFELEKGDGIYVFSDGYVDQFGGERNKKFNAKAFRKLLLGIQEKSMEEQKVVIDKAFEDWRGDYEQIDDVCVIGVRIN